MKPRYSRPHIEADLSRKIFFVGGPRQCGKTHVRDKDGREVDFAIEALRALDPWK